MQYSPPGILLPMTVIVAIKSDHGAVLAGDKRAHTGDNNLAYHDHATKVFQLNKHVSIGGAGDGYDAQLVIDELIKHKQIQSLDVDEVKDLAYQIATKKQAELYLGDNGFLMAFRAKAPLFFGFLIVGLTKSGEPKIYSITHDKLTPREITENYCAIGVPLLAEYICSKELKKNATLKDLENLAIKSIQETSSRVTAVSPTYDVIPVSNK